ncbi:MAG: glutathione S-transferase N-terminal domain-containing protein [Rhizonema sp. NSF051]|nr:glutathione S-transferase N-terminal domain-containing protein [Rhizonema sp. NSF051]
MMNGALVLTAGESKWHCDIRDLMLPEIPWRFVEKERIANSSQERVPVLVDGDQMIGDSWEIARYLEVTYPNHSLFGGAIALGETLFIRLSS